MLPKEAVERKEVPICTGVLDYFPDALAWVARCSKAGNDQHNPGQPLHWSKGKSMDHADCLVRHLLERGTIDTDGIPHSVKVAWRALALLQTEIDNGMYQGESEITPSTGRNDEGIEEFIQFVEKTNQNGTIKIPVKSYRRRNTG